ncbi:MAG: acid phosphatase [Opitutae bacterium]|nr:acid phosphatase [Opitutae bacterium]
MNKPFLRWLPALLALALFGCSSAPASREPQNLYLLKQEIKAYIDQGYYEQDLAHDAAVAEAWILQRTAQRGQKLALVFDIDETTLSNLPHMRAQDFGYVPDHWDAWVAEARAPVIEPVRRIYQAARARGVAVIFLTGRKESDRPGTEKNLHADGFTDYLAIHFKPVEPAQTTEAFKTAMRKKYTEEGWTIIANIGDQRSDLNGGYAERTFKLPNPFYITK